MNRHVVTRVGPWRGAYRWRVWAEGKLVGYGKGYATSEAAGAAARLIANKWWFGDA